MDARIIGFASGKGGTGKSTVAYFVAEALAARQKRTLLLELAPALRCLDVLSGVGTQAVYDLEDVVSGRCSPDSALLQSPHQPELWLLPAPYAGGTIAADEIFDLCEFLRPHFDYILLDTATGLGTAFYAMAETAHYVYLVLTADPLALRAGRVAADGVYRLVEDTRVIFNMVDPERITKSKLLEDLDGAIDTVGLQLLGVVPHSEAIRNATWGGKPLRPKSREAAIFSAIAQRIEGLDVPLVFG